jgi:hypothetical protein
MSRPQSQPGQQLINAAKIKLIKTAVRQLDMADADYRALLQRAAGATSAKDVTLEAFDAVMAEFHRLGFRYTPSKRIPKGASPGTAPNRPTPAQLRLIEFRAKEVGYAGLDDPRFINWMKARGHVEHPRFLDSAGARRVIGALGNWIKHRSKPQTTTTKGQA